VQILEGLWAMIREFARIGKTDLEANKACQDGAQQCCAPTKVVLVASGSHAYVDRKEKTPAGMPFKDRRFQGKLALRETQM
jgi:hypothetical protein